METYLRSTIMIEYILVCADLTARWTRITEVWKYDELRYQSVNDERMPPDSSSTRGTLSNIAPAFAAYPVTSSPSSNP